MQSLRSWTVLCAAAVLLWTAWTARAQCPGGLEGTWTVGPGQRIAGPLGIINAAMAFDLDGSGPDPVRLLVGGNFAIVDAAPAASLATWDGAQWRVATPGVLGSINAMTLFNGDLYVAGTFLTSGSTTLNRIARWSPTGGPGGSGAWLPLGTGLNGTVNALAVYNNRLYVGGEFTTAGGVAANRIASWDGALWRPLGTAGAGGGGGVDRTTPPGSGVVFYTPFVNALTVFNGQLVVGGRFDTTNGNLGTYALATFDGNAWSSLGLVAHNGTFLPVPEIHALAVNTSQLTNSTTLYVGGDFDSIAGVNARFIASYRVVPFQTPTWNAVGSTIGGPVETLLLDLNVVGLVDAIIVSTSQRSSLETPPPTWVRGIYRLASGVWNLYSSDTTQFLGSYNGEIIAGIRGLSHRVGQDWLPFGNGLNSIPRFMVSSAGSLYAFGAFTVADQQIVNGAARLDAAGHWHPVGAGVLGGANGLTFISDAAAGADGTIFVAGFAPTTNNVQYKVLRFDGTNWVLALTVQPVGREVRLATAGSPAIVYALSSDVRRWNGFNFAAVGGGFLPGNDSPNDVAVYNGAIHISGEDLYRLDGSSWTVAGTVRGQFHGCFALGVYNSRLFGSMFQQGPSSIDELIGTQFVEHTPELGPSHYLEKSGVLLAQMGSFLGRFDGTTWSPAATLAGTSAPLLIHQGQLIVPGTTSVNSITSPVFARLKCCSADFNDSGTVEPADIFFFLNAWFAQNGQIGSNLSADTDNSGTVAPADIFFFLDAWFSQNGQC